MYTIYYLDDSDRVQKTQGGFSTLQDIHQRYALVKVKSGDKNLLTVIGGVLDDIEELARKGLYSSEESPKGAG